MIEKEQAERIAGAIACLRPDWSEKQIMGVLADPRIRERRIFRDVAIAMTALALDPASRQPTRIFEHGHWWEILAPRPTEQPTPMPPRLRPDEFRVPADSDRVTPDFIDSIRASLRSVS